MNTVHRIDYDLENGDSRRTLAGFGIVLALHIALGYALANGLGRKALHILQNSLDVAIIEEVKQPEAKPPPPPKIVKIQKSYVPPPEVPVQAPVSAPTITATTATPEPPRPVEPVRVVPQPVAVSVACPNHAAVRSGVQYPAQAQRLGLSGDVVVEFVLGAGGEIKDISVVRSSNPVFNAAATAAVGQLRCNGQGQEARVRVPFVFRLDS